MGRLIGLPHFQSKQAFAEEKQDIIELRKARGELSQNYDPLNPDEDDPIKERQVKIAERMQQQFEKRIIRRTIDSVDWTGAALNPLPPRYIGIVLLDLADSWDIKIIDYLPGQVKAK
jgi:hypothetical protein